MAKKLINTTVKLGVGTLLEEAINSFNGVFNTTNVDNFSFNADNIRETELRVTNANTSNIPSSTWGLLVTIKFTSNHSLQLWTSQSANETYIRTYWSASQWRSWNQL